jgi:hypothetical protein
MVPSSSSPPSSLTLNLSVRTTVVVLTRWVLLIALYLGLALGLCAPVVTAQTKTATTTTLAVTSGGTAVTSVSSGSLVTLTATATVNAGAMAVTPGQVNFCDALAKLCTDVHLLGMAQLTSAGTATLKLRPGIGSHSYKVVFLGTNTYAGSASGASALVVTGIPAPTATATTIAESGSWGNYTLTATVTEAGQTTAPTGAVSFLDTSNGNSAVASGTLGAAVAGVGWPSPKSLPNAPDTYFVLVGDLNGDGIPDLVLDSNYVAIYLGNADGTYTQAATPSIQGPTSHPMVIADFNGDGIPDLAVPMYGSNRISILLGKGDGTFAAPLAANVPGTIVDIAQILSEDFNGDGIADLTVIDSIGSTVDILLGNGDGSFTTEATHPPISGIPSYFATGDFNGDGKADLAIEEGGGSIAVLLGDGDGTFTAASTVNSGIGGSPIAVADFDGDGKLDLALAAGGTAGTTESVTILTGNGDGTFNSSSSGKNQASTAVTWIQVADFNRDGAPDVVLADSTGSATVLLNKGSGLFSKSFPVVTGLSTPYYLEVGVGDLNGDGYPDIVTGGYYNSTIGLYITEPEETAAASADISLPAGLHQVDASYGGDGDYDPSLSGTTPLWGTPPTTTTSLTLTSGGSQVTTVTPGTVITFTATVAAAGIPVTHGQVAFCDAAAVSCTDIHLLGTVALKGAGMASFNFVPGPGTHSYKAMFVQDGYGLTSSSNASTLTVGPAKSPVYSDTATITGVGGGAGNYSLTATVVGYGGTAPPAGAVAFLDTSFGNTSLATVQLGASKAGLGWKVSKTPVLSNPSISELEGDFNGDGLADLALLWTGSSGPGGITILFGNGDGTFKTGPTTQASVAVQYTDLYMIAGDFNGDGKLDVVVLSYSSSDMVDYVTTFLGNGDGTFTAPAKSPVFNQGPVGGDVISGSMVAADFNGDGKLDLAVAGDYVNSGGVTILLGDGDGTFNAITSNFAANQGFQQIATGDFNRDGIPDLVAANYFDPGGATILLGKGDGTFSVQPTQLAVDRFPTSIIVGDFNGDGKADLTFGYNFELIVFIGNGDGTFKPAPGSPMTAGTENVSMVAGDFNHDGKLDLAALDTYNDLIDLFVGAGDGTFTFTTTTPAISPNFLGPIAIVASDFNGDGLPDLAMLDKYVTTAAILLAEPTQTATAIVNGLAPIGPGTHNVEASYSGDSNYSSAVSATVALNAGLAPLVISPSGGVFSSTQTVTITESVPGSTIYYALDGTVSTNGYLQYTGPIPLAIGGSETISAYATETGYQQSGYATATFTLNLPLAPAPTFSPAAGSFLNPQTITISDTASGATIYYTTDGWTPTTNSAIYTGPITVSMSETITAIATASGYSPSAVVSAQYFVNSPPVFVTQQYLDFLDRQPDSGGLNAWVSALNNGMSRAQLIADFIGSNEFAGKGLFVAQAYVGLLGRDADSSGFRGWLNWLENGGGTELGIVTAFINSSEFQNNFGANLTDTQFVTLMYQNVLLRQPDSGGLNAWVSYLTSGGTRPQVALGFLQSPEFAQLKSSENRVTISLLYFDMLRRQPDSGGFTAWIAALNSGTALTDIINAFLNSQEYASRFQ